jgi:hypothetical protein
VRGSTYLTACCGLGCSALSGVTQPGTDRSSQIPRDAIALRAQEIQVARDFATYRITKGAKRWRNTIASRSLPFNEA